MKRASMRAILSENTAQWRSGNAAVCKTAMHGFDSRSRLQRSIARSVSLRDISRRETNPFTGVLVPPADLPQGEIPLDASSISIKSPPLRLRGG